MAQVICIRLDWDRTALPLPAGRLFYTVRIGPEPEYPFGRKGLALARAWSQLAVPDTAGMLLLDGDVVIDPEDHRQMLAAIDADPGVVHTAPARIWPVSTKRAQWCWAHWETGPGQHLDRDPRWFSFCYTYLPRQLIEQAGRDGLRIWAYPSADKHMSETCQKLGLRVNVVADCWPKHVNY
jgi:hypothetical protein